MTTTVKPSTDCETRWSGKKRLADKFLKLRPHLLKLSDHPSYTAEFDKSLLFMKKVENAQLWMAEVDELNVAMQGHCISLADCDLMISELANDIETLRKSGRVVDKQRNPYHKCPLIVKKALPTNKKLVCPNADFITGVVKIQFDDWKLLSPKESAACTHPLKKKC